MSLIEFKNVSFRYGREVVLENICLNIEKGSFTVICGFSGSGKTTLLRLMKPSLMNEGEVSGDILFCGEKETDRRSDTRKAAFVGQYPEREMTGEKVWQHIVFTLESLGYDNAFIRKRAAETATYFGISHIFEAENAHLSGGEKQLVNLAAAVVTDPDVIILDEPTAEIDPVGRDRLMDMLVKINRDLGIAIVISEHSLERCVGIADKIIMLDEGKIVFSGGKREASVFVSENSYYAGLFNDMVRLAAALKRDIPFNAAENRAFAEGLGVTGRLEDEEKKERTAAVSFKELWFGYGKRDILKGASGVAYKGEVYALMGANGAGKSTLLSVLANTQKPHRGKVGIASDAVTGYLPQNPMALFFKNTIIEDMLSVTDDEELIKQTALLCSVEGLMQRHPYDVSGGELQRAALCKVLLRRPDIIFMDEPTKGMDAAFRKKFAELILSLKKKGHTVFMVSHDTDFCALAADRCGLFFGGRITSEGQKREFFEDNRFYTTALNRAFKGIIDGALSQEDVLCVMGIKNDEAKKPDVKKRDTDISFRAVNKKGTRSGAIVMLAVITAIAVGARLAFFMLPQFKPVAAVIILAASVFGPAFGLVSGAMSMFVSNMFFGQGPWTLFQMAGMGLTGLFAGLIFKRSGYRRYAVTIYSALSVLILYGVTVNISNVLMYQDSITLAMLMASCVAALPMDILHAAFTAALVFIAGREFTDKLIRVRKKYRIGKLTE